MTAQEIVNEVRRLGGRLEMRGDRLRVDVPKGVLTPELRQTSAEFKHELLVLLER